MKRQDRRYTFQVQHLKWLFGRFLRVQTYAATYAVPELWCFRPRFARELAAMGRHAKSCWNDVGPTERSAWAPVFSVHLKNRGSRRPLAFIFQRANPTEYVHSFKVALLQPGNSVRALNFFQFTHTERQRPAIRSCYGKYGFLVCILRMATDFTYHTKK